MAGKRRHAVAVADRGLTALAALWESWPAAPGERVPSFAIITTRRNELRIELHDLISAIFGSQTWSAWLGEDPVDPIRLKAMLAPYPSDEMMCWPVSARVANVKINDAEPD